jgi:hypothetical protein
MMHRPAGARLARAISLLALAVVGCGLRAAKPTDVPTFGGDPVGQGNSGQTGPTNLTDQANPVPGVPAATLIPPPPPEPQQGLTSQLVAAAGGRKLYIEQLDSLLLFGEERLAAQQLIADWATAAGLSVLPPKQTEEIFALAAVGKNPMQGAACGPALDRGLTRERWLPRLGAAGRIDASVSCEDGCVLQLAIELNGLGTEFFAAPFDPAQPALQELALRLPTVVDNGGDDQQGHGNNPVPILGATPGPGAAEALPGDSTRLALSPRSEAAIAKMCGVTFAPVEVLLAPSPPGPTGSVPRCEAMADSDSWREINPKVNACVCAAISKAHKIEGRRHAAIDETQPIGPQSLETKNGLIASGEVVSTQGNGEQMAWFLPGSSSLSHCLLARTQERATTQLAVIVDFDRDGVVVKSSIGDLDGVLKKDERECVLKVLKTARAPCPEQPTSSGVGYVWLSVRKE